MPVAKLIELRVEAMALAARAAPAGCRAARAEPAEREQELDVLREPERLVVSADGVEVVAPAEHDADASILVAQTTGRNIT